MVDAGDAVAAVTDDMFAADAIAAQAARDVEEATTNLASASKQNLAKAAQKMAEKAAELEENPSSLLNRSVKVADQEYKPELLVFIPTST